MTRAASGGMMEEHHTKGGVPEMKHTITRLIALILTLVIFAGGAGLTR
jgi:hypothetical protein